MSGTGRVTQDHVEALGEGNDPARVTQDHVEALALGALTEATVVTQFAVEALAEDVFPSRITQMAIEILECSSIAGAEAATTCALWEIRRRDGLVQRFAALDQDVVYGGQIYSAAAPFQATASEVSRSLAAGQMEVSGLLSSPSLRDEDLMNGLYDGATVIVSRVDWVNPSRGVEVMFSGRIGSVTAGETQFTAEMFLPTKLLDQTVLDVYSASCRVDLGSPRCGVNLAGVTEAHTITAVTDGLVFGCAGLGQPANWANYGRVTITSGANAGETRDIAAHAAGGTIVLWRAFNAPLVAGDTCSIVAGCNKRISTCREKFSNHINFRGFPAVPGQDALLRTPDAR